MEFAWTLADFAAGGTAAIHISLPCQKLGRVISACVVHTPTFFTLGLLGDFARRIGGGMLPFYDMVFASGLGFHRFHAG